MCVSASVCPSVCLFICVITNRDRRTLSHFHSHFHIIKHFCRKCNVAFEGWLILLSLWMKRVMNWMPKPLFSVFSTGAADLDNLFLQPPRPAADNVRVPVPSSLRFIQRSYSGLPLLSESPFLPCQSISQSLIRAKQPVTEDTAAEISVLTGDISIFNAEMAGI